jgi:hypothetical protein
LATPLSIDIIIIYLNVIVSSPNTGVNIATTSLMIDQVSHSILLNPNHTCTGFAEFSSFWEKNEVVAWPLH